MPYSRKISPKDVGEICELYQKGKLLREIAVHYRVTEAAIAYWLRKKGIKRRPCGYKSRLTLEEIQTISRQYSKGKSPASLAKEFGVSNGAIIYWLVRMGTPRNQKSKGLTTTEKNDVLELYRKGMSTVKLAKKFGVSDTCIAYWLEKNEVPRRAQAKLTQKDIKAICVDYVDNDKLPSIRDLAKKYKVGATTIKEWLKKKGIPRRWPLKYALDETVFDKASEQRDYWIGFMIADGNVGDTGKGNPVITLELKKGDLEHVKKFKDFLGATHPISTRRGRAKRTGKYFWASKLSVSSQRLAMALKSFGVVPRKTSVARIKKLTGSRDLWRGVIDGDGSPSLQKKCAGLSLPGSKSLTAQFAKFAQAYLSDYKTPVVAKPKKGTKTWCVSICGKRAAVIIRLLYAGCDPSAVLIRKKIIANKIIKKYFKE